MSKFRVNLIREEAKVKEAIDIIKTITSCHYDQIDDNRHFAMEAMHHRNPYLWQNMWGPKDKIMLKLLRNWTKPIDEKERKIP
jgi:hypothetical protein